jgi:DNA polymerase I-like protein with 3'-5' exonuclease and polymerase domains
MTLQKIKDALDSLELTYRTERDGSLITDCPVCELENKGAGKLKVFSDGRVACYRFAGIDRGEHRKEILDSFRAEHEKTSSERSAFITETLFDGSLTIEIERAARDRQTITARNCDSVLHVDAFNLADAGRRSKFIRALSLDPDKVSVLTTTLVQLADRFASAEKALDKGEGPQKKKVLFAALADGRRAELTSQGFAVYDPSRGETTYEHTLTDDDGTVYEAGLTASEAEKMGIYMPSGVEEYGDLASLNASIIQYIDRYVDLKELDLQIAAKYPLISYQTEKLFEICYLRAVGKSGNGKSRFAQTIGLICRYPIACVGISAAALFRTIDLYRPTLIVDEFNVAAEGEDSELLMKILNAGVSRFAKVLRAGTKETNFAPVGFDPFGAKILAGLNYTNSPAFESRTHPVRLEETRRNDISLQMLPEMLAEAESIRNKLTLWRLRTFDESNLDRSKQSEQELKDAGGIRKRLIQLAIPIYSVLDSDEIKADFIRRLQSRTEDAASQSAETIEGQLARAVHSRLFTETGTGENVVTVMREYSPEIFCGVEGKPDERLTTSSISEEVNKGLTDKESHDARYIGKVLSNMDLKSARVSRRASPAYKQRALNFNSQRLISMFAEYRLPFPPDFDGGNGGSDANPSETTIILPPSDSNNAPDAVSWGQDNYKNTNDLHDCPRCPHQKPDETGNGETHTSFSTDLVALDTETEVFNKKLGIDHRNAKMIGMSLSYDGQLADYSTDKDSWNFLMPDIEQTVIFHNAKFDFGVLQRAGLPVPRLFEDTLVAAHLLDENNAHGLKPLSKKHLGIDDPITFEEADRMRLLDPEVFAKYARNDARYTFRLWEQFQKELGDQELRTVYEMEKHLLPVVMRMEDRGMKLDIKSLAAIEREVKAESARLKTEIFDLAGMEFELNKPLSVGVVLFDKLGLKCPKQTAKGARSVDSESLKEIAHPLAVKILEYRSIDKLANTFIKVLPKFADENGRIHPEFKPLGAATGRFSCASPNVQQIPGRSELGRAIRRAFICEPGNKLIVADFSQMELRVLAHYSQDETLLKAYCNGEETDLHTITAQKIFGRTDVDKNERGIAKMINFGIAYGITDVGLYRRLTTTGIDTTPKDCKRYISDYFKTYKGVKSFLTKVDKTIRTRGYVKNLFGRRRRLKGNNAREIRQAQNFIIQATSADLVKRSMVALDSKLPDGAQLISMVHDELIIECRSDNAEDVLGIVVEVMQDTPEGFNVPMPVDAHIVDCWADAK